MKLDELMALHQAQQVGATNAPASAQAPAPAQGTPWAQAALGGLPELSGSIAGGLSGQPIGGPLGRLSALGTKAGIESIPAVGQLAPSMLGQDYQNLSPQGLPEQLLYHGTQTGATVGQLAQPAGWLAKSMPGLAANTFSNRMTKGGILGGLYGGVTGAVQSGVDQTKQAFQNQGLGLAAPASMLPQMGIDAIKQAIPTAAQFAAFDAGGLIGAKLGAKAAPLEVGKGLMKKFGPKVAQNIHEASARAGGAVAGGLTGFGTAMMVGAPQEEQVAQALLGGAMNAITPSGTQRIQRKPKPPAPTLDKQLPPGIEPRNAFPRVEQRLLESPSQQVWDRINAKTEQIYNFNKEQRINLESDKQIRIKLRKMGMNEDVVLDTTPMQDVKDYLRLADHHATLGDPVMAENYIGLANKMVDDLANSNKALLLSAKNPTPEDNAVRSLAESESILGSKNLKIIAEYLNIPFGQALPGSNDFYLVNNSNMSPVQADMFLKDAFKQKFDKAVPFTKLSKAELHARTPEYKEKIKTIDKTLEKMVDGELRRQAREQAVQEVLMESWNEKVGQVAEAEIRSMTAEELLIQSGQTPAMAQLAANPELAMRVQKLGWDPALLHRMTEKYKTVSLEDMVAAEEQIAGMGPVPNDAKTTMDLFRVIESIDGKVKGFLDGWLLRPMQSARVKIVEEATLKIASFAQELKNLGFTVKDRHLFGGKAYNQKQADRFGKYLNGELLETQLNPKEAKQFAALKQVYKRYTDDIFNEMKPILKELGYGELNYRENYFAWYREDKPFSAFEVGTQDVNQANRRARAQEVAYRHMMRKGDDTANLVDPFRALELVIQDAARLKAYEPIVQRAKFLAERADDKGRLDIHNLVDDLASGMIGARQRSAYDDYFSEHPVGRGIVWLTDNFVGNVLTTFNPVLNQVLGLPAISAEMGEFPLITTGRFGINAAREFWGIFARRAIDPSAHSNYLKYSDFAKARELGNHNSLSQRANLAEHAFAGMYKYLDRTVGATAWNMGYEKAMKMKMTHDEAVRYGDLIASRTQGVFDTLLKPKLLQGPLGRVIAPLSTGTFAAFNTLFPDIIQNKGLSAQSKAKRIGYQIGMTVAVQMGLAAFYGGSNDIVKYFEDAVIAQVPVLGGLVRSGMSGPVGTIGRFVDSPTPTSLARVGAILSPVRGTYQALKTFEGIKGLMNDGMVYDKNGEPLYQFDTSSINDVLRSIVFSPSKTQAGRDRYAYLNSSITKKVAGGVDALLSEMGINSYE